MPEKGWLLKYLVDTSNKKKKEFFRFPILSPRVENCAPAEGTTLVRIDKNNIKKIPHCVIFGLRYKDCYKKIKLFKEQSLHMI